MKVLCFVFALVALTSCASPPPAPVGVQITVTAERAAQCQAAGGCGLLSEAEVEALMRHAFEQGAQQAATVAESRLDSHGCVRDRT